MKRRTLVLAFAFLLPVGSHAAVFESVVARIEGLRLGAQIQNVQKGASYEVGIFSIDAEEPVAVLTVPKTDSDSSDLEPVALPEGIYHLRMKKNGRWLPAAPLRPVTLPVQGFRLVSGVIERRMGEIIFRLPTSGIYRAVATTEAAMAIKLLSAWKFGGSGEKLTITWDFMDQARVQNHATSVGVAVILDFIPLPSEYCVVGSPPFSRYAASSLFAGLQLPMDTYVAKLSFPGASRRNVQDDLDANNIPVIGPGAVLEVVLDEKSTTKLEKRRYEILYFADGEFIHEEIDGVSPARLILPDLRRDDGPVYLTVNVKDLFGNFGSSAIKAWWRGPKS